MTPPMERPIGKVASRPTPPLKLRPVSLDHPTPASKAAFIPSLGSTDDTKPSPSPPEITKELFAAFSETEAALRLGSKNRSPSKLTDPSSSLVPVVLPTTSAGPVEPDAGTSSSRTFALPPSTGRPLGARSTPLDCTTKAGIAPLADRVRRQSPVVTTLLNDPVGVS